MEISNVAQLICKCRRIKEFPRGVGRASAGGGIRREDLPRRNGLTMGHHKVAHQRNLAAWLQANRRWLTQSRRYREPRGAVVVEATENAPCCTGKTDRGQDAGQLFRVIVKVDHNERIVAHQWIHRNEEARQGGSDGHRIV